MTVAVALSVEGVLAGRLNEHALIGSSAPVRAGVRLLASLAATHKVVLLSDEVNPVPIEHWLKQQGLSEFYGLLLTRKPIEAELDHTALRASQYAFLKGCGFNVDLVIDHDPGVINHMLQQGCASMLFAHPTYLRPEFRPDDDRGVRAWAEIADEMEHQNLLKAGDVRLLALNEEAAEVEVEDEEEAFT